MGTNQPHTHFLVRLGWIYLDLFWVRHIVPEQITMTKLIFLIKSLVSDDCQLIAEIFG